METITGKQSCSLGAGELARLAAQYDQVLIDLGTGDGKYVLHQARSEPRLLAVGVDACRENLRAGSRAAPENALFVIANALALPAELDGLAHRITVNFPWGSLLEALLEGNEALLGGLLRAARPGAAVEIRLNLSAVRAAQETAGLDWAGKLVCCALAGAGLRVSAPRMLDSAVLRTLPSTWARKMASGRSPEAVEIIGWTRGEYVV